MKIAYLDCWSGIAGDMMLAALVDLGLPLEVLQSGIDSLGLPSCRLVVSEVKRKGFRAKHLAVEYEPEHAHRHLHHIEAMVEGSTLSPRQRALAMKIFTRLGEAEARVHGTDLKKVHFHEVGAVDSIADIVGCAIGLDWLGCDRIECSSVPTGHGEIVIDHGRVTIPAPATGELLKGVPLRASDVEGELTTPTGAAIVASVVDQFGGVPPMVIESIGYGAGTKEWAQQANLLRVMVGSRDELTHDQVWVLETNLDDCSGEVIGFATEKLFQAGALDVYCTAIQMKKNRPAVKLTVLGTEETRKKLERMILRETGSLGVRKWLASRTRLERQACEVTTAWGVVRGKVAWMDDGESLFSPEYESLREIAESSGETLIRLDQAARQAYLEGPSGDASEAR